MKSSLSASIPKSRSGAFWIRLFMVPTAILAQQKSASGQSLGDQVAQIASNDQRQDIRLYQLEKEVDKVSGSLASSPSTVESGTTKAPTLVPYTGYKVRKGDSLWRIAMTHRVSPGDIMAFNRMPNETVTEGQMLMIPNKGGASTMPNHAPSGFHTVKPNETFHSISKQYGVSVSAFTKANPNVNPNKLQTGAKLAIPSSAKAYTPPAPPKKEMAYDYGLPAPEKKSTGTTYTVVSGDSLGAIAKAHGIPTATLQKANGMTDPNSLRVGQKLKIPAGASKQTPSKPTVTQTPTKPKPAAPNPGTGVAYEPKPPTPPTAPSPAPSQPSVAPNRGVVAYRMEKGDTIDSVAQMFGTSGTEVRRLNKMSATSAIAEGDEILVPGMGPVAGN
jgi:LysM repeat protein